MKMARNIALVGNPNTGKSSIFNLLTGLSQKTGNYSGVTVEKKQGRIKLSDKNIVKILDLPGIYSLSSVFSMDEKVVLNTLVDRKHEDFPDLIVVVAEAEHLKRNLLLYTQIIDLKIPTILIINMADTMARKGITIDIPKLEECLDSKVLLVSVRKNQGFKELKSLLNKYDKIPKGHIDLKHIEEEDFRTKDFTSKTSVYASWLEKMRDSSESSVSDLKKIQHRDSVVRYQYINHILKDTYKVNPLKRKGISGALDSILMHRVYGYIVFFLILGSIFQSIYSWSSYPMELIDRLFFSLSEWVKLTFPSGEFTNMIADGVLAGIGGVILFIPQIVLLFMFITILEESGYMSRVVYLMDRIMSRFGLSGKSIIPLISGVACAIPAVMAARNIESSKERLLAILVIPFMTCSARLPVYLIIISIAIPDVSFFGLNLQGMTLLCLYLLGFGTSLFTAYILDKIIKIQSKNNLIIEVPSYKIPLLKNIFIAIIQRSKIFVLGAGKIILAISVVLWFLSSHGNYDQEQINTEVVQKLKNTGSSPEDIQKKIDHYKLEHSYIGRVGKFIEPVVIPLGYDWKIAIALITSFAAREVFVGTMATIYSTTGSNDTIKNEMKNDINSNTGQPLFNLPSGISLLLFYTFAMQCMSTLAVVKRETNSWKWPLMQFTFMTVAAYFISLSAYQILISLT